MRKVVGIVNLVAVSTFAFGMDISKSVNIHKPIEDQIRKVELTYQTETSSKSKLLSDIVKNLESKPSDKNKYFISMLKDRGLEAVNNLNPSGFSLLMSAVSDLNDELVQLLFQVPNIDLNLKDNHGDPAFEYLYGKVEEEKRQRIYNIIKMFIDDDRVDVCMLNTFGFSPLCSFIDYRQYDVAKLMLNLIEDKKGSDFLNKVVNQECKNSQTPLRLAVRNKEEDMIKTLLDHGAILKDKLVHQLMEKGDSEMLGFLLMYYIHR